VAPPGAGERPATFASPAPPPRVMPDNRPKDGSGPAGSDGNRPAPPAHLLVVEDDAALRELVARRFGEAGYRVDTAATGPEALDAVAAAVPDLVLLDVMLPGMDGVEVCRRLRADHPLLTIVMLTARADELDRVVGLEVGADDYVTKPFSLPELVARVRAALRRIRTVRERMGTAPPAEGEAPMAFDELVVDPARRTVTRGGEEVHLTAREFDLLLFLARHADRPFTRLQLLEGIWGITYEGYDRTIDSHIQRLRAKIEAEPGRPRFVRTVWGVGYKFAARPEA
jgi:DNA-binding response OmpR family regulator